MPRRDVQLEEIRRRREAQRLSERDPDARQREAEHLRLEVVEHLHHRHDTVVLLRYFEAFGRVRRAISVIKKRTGAHEDTIREFWISERGIGLGEPLTGFQGILRGVPLFAVLDLVSAKRHLGQAIRLINRATEATR